VYLQGTQWITLENSYQPLPKEQAIRSETGLENIRKRYQHLSARTISVSCDHHFFKVDLPLLEIDE
jgi:indole-3-glycerol phosphate synthase